MLPGCPVRLSVHNHFQNGNCFLLSTIKWITVVTLFVLKNWFKDKDKTKNPKERLITTTAKIRSKDELIVSRLDCNIQMRQWRTKERGKDQVLIEGRARTQSPTLTNYAPEFPTFGEIAGFNATEVQWWSLDLKELPCWSQYPLSQVSMLSGVHFCDWSKSLHLKPSTMLYLKWTSPKWNLGRKKKDLYSNSFQRDSTQMNRIGKW